MSRAFGRCAMMLALLAMGMQCVGCVAAGPVSIDGVTDRLPDRSRGATVGTDDSGESIVVEAADGRTWQVPSSGPLEVETSDGETHEFETPYRVEETDDELVIDGESIPKNDIERFSVAGYQQVVGGGGGNVGQTLAAVGIIFLLLVLLVVAGGGFAPGFGCC